MLNGALTVNPLNKISSEVVILRFSKILAKPKTSIREPVLGAKAYKFSPPNNPIGS